LGGAGGSAGRQSGAGAHRPGPVWEGVAHLKDE